MKRIEKEVYNIQLYPLSGRISADAVLYFDIETTGLSANTSYLYMIGFLTQKAGRVYLTQMLAEDISEEKELVQRFFQIAAGYQHLVHYNGQTFDIPYLMKKAARYRIQNPFQTIKSVDIYREIRNMKQAFTLPDLKLSTIGQFLGLIKKDVFSGEDLIQLYAEYTGFLKLAALQPDTFLGKAEALQQALLLHNAEDLMELAEAVKLLYIIQYIKNIQDESITITIETDRIKLALQNPGITIGSAANPICLRLTKKEAGKNLSGFGMLQMDSNTIVFEIPFYQGELKIFFEPCEEYYYLPEEDMAVHKSVGEFVEKAFRQKAKKSTCYQRKTGIFLPAGKPSADSIFRKDYQDKDLFFEFMETFDEATARRYIRDIIEILGH